MNKRSNNLIAALLISAQLLTGCALVGGYSSRSLEHVTSLKALHEKIIDDNTQGSGKSYDPVRLAADTDEGEKKFREATEYAKALEDKLRTTNMDLLHDIYKDDTAYIKNKKRLLTVPEAKTLKDPTDFAYEQAIKGETVRKESRSE